MFCVLTCREASERCSAAAQRREDALQTMHSADSDCCAAAAVSSSDHSSHLHQHQQLHRYTAVTTLPSASLLMSELLMQQQQQQPVTIKGRTDSDDADTDALTLTRCASPGLLTDITSLLASYQHF